MPTTKQDLANASASISGVITSIGNTIKENKRKTAVDKILKEYNDANKLFLNPDGTPKSDTEMANTLNWGVTNLIQLGEKDLANSLTTYYGQVSKGFSTEAQNLFNYSANKEDARFPKGQDGKSMSFNPRVDYPDWTGTKQYKPIAETPTYSFRQVNMKGPDGSGVVKYMRENKKTGEVDIVDESEYTKTINESRISSSQTFYNATPTAQSFKDKDGNIINASYKGGKYYDPTTGKSVDITGMTPIGENQGIDFKNLTAVQFEKSIQENVQAMQKDGIPMLDGTTWTPSALEAQQIQDYIMGRTNTYPGKLYDIDKGVQINGLRQNAQDMKIGNWAK